MKRIAILFLAAICICNIGCAKKVFKNWEAAGGSRADATVEVGYIYNPETEIPQHNEQQGYTEAIKRCQAWGYAEAEPFGLVKSSCQQFSQGFGGPVCISMFVSRQYQCLGRGDSKTPFEEESTPKKR